MSSNNVLFKGNDPRIAAYQFSVTDAAGAVTDLGKHTQDAFPLTFTAPALAAGAAVFSLQALDASDNPVGSPITDSVTVAAPAPDNIPVSMVISL